MRIDVVVPAVLVAALACLQLNGAAPLAGAFAQANSAAGAEGTAKGTLFHDLDEDGIREDGEPGFSGQPVELLAGGQTVQSTVTGLGGAYSLMAPPGEYTLRADTNFHDGYCIDSFGSFDPLALDECLSVEVPWAFTTPQEASVTVEPGATETVDFGVREADVDVLAGVAIYQNSGAPGAIIEAYAGDTRCGQTEVEGHGPNTHNYELAVFGAREIDGCAEPGDEVTIFIDGLQATIGQSMTDETYTYRSSGSVNALPLVALKDYAVYWAQELIFPDAFGGGGVSAWVDGGRCQGAHVDLIFDFFGNRWLGFSVDVPPRDDVWPHCGYPGAEVRFRLGFDGAEGEVGRATWEPGIHKVDIQFAQGVGSGDVNCSRSVDAVDALAVLRTIANVPADKDCYRIADVDCSGYIDPVDALRILQYVADIPFDLPPGCPPVNRSAP